MIAVEAFPIRGQASHFPEHLQMSLLLLSLRARCHGREQQAAITGEEVWSRDPGQGGCLSGQTCPRVTVGGGRGRHLAERSSTGDCWATDKLLLLHGERERQEQPHRHRRHLLAWNDASCFNEE